MAKISAKTAAHLRWAFNEVVGSDRKEWKMTKDLAAGKSTRVREFEHRATKDTVKITETTRYDPLDEMNVTYVNVTGSYKGQDVKGTLISKPRID
ncbi:MAG: hypothetical protein ACAH83_02350 [Alphaproteobacteria bacterium]